MNKTLKDAAKESFGIADMFHDHELIQQNDGCYKMECPSCGLQGGRTPGFILFPDTNIAYCHSSSKSFSILEAYAIKKGIAGCIDKEEGSPMLTGDLWKDTLSALKDEFTEENYEKIMELSGVKVRMEIPGDGRLESEFAYDIGKKMSNKDIVYYRPEMQSIVEVFKTVSIKDEEEFGGMVEVKPPRFITIIEEFIVPYRSKPTMTGGMIQVNKSLGATSANICMMSSNFRDITKPLNRIFTVPIPIIKDNELIFPSKGYDERFSSFLPHNAPHITEPNMKIDEAVVLIKEVYSEFCFKDEQSRTNAISALLTPFVRGLFPKFSTRAPVYCYVANKERAGKDYCANITGLIFEGVALEEPPISTGDKNGDSNNELRKKIFTAMMQGRKRLHFSNNKGLINSAVFEGVTTSESYSDRVLGSNTMYSFPNEIDYSLSGNIDVSLSADLMARSRMVELFLEIEDPNSRIYNKPDLHGWVTENRSRILSALYAIVRNWVEKDMPEGNTFTSFSHWARIVGGAMMAAGLGDPCVKPICTLVHNHENTDFKTLWEDCYEKYPNEWVTRRQILEIIEENDDIFTWVDVSDKSKITSFWLRFRNKMDTYFTGILMQGDGNKRSQLVKYRFGKNRGDTSILSLNPENVSPMSPPAVSVSVNLCRISDDSAKVTKVTEVTCSTNKENIGKPAQIKPKIKIPKLEDTKKKVTKSNTPENDRQVQFWEAEECKSISPKCTKQEVLDYIKSNEDKTINDVYNKLGDGSPKFVGELIGGGKIDDNKGKLQIRK